MQANCHSQCIHILINLNKIIKNMFQFSNAYTELRDSLLQQNLLINSYMMPVFHFWIYKLIICWAIKCLIIRVTSFLLVAIKGPFVSFVFSKFQYHLGHTYVRSNNASTEYQIYFHAVSKPTRLIPFEAEDSVATSNQQQHPPVCATDTNTLLMQFLTSL